ncbi:MAG: hypothetical protein HXS41_11400 [Theionarchaea archaeon]|nr:hypothetical protein [Theionarchaea archaeon]MBU7000049.1 hypothetical protein [Theionarchaea archaeon]MBU7021653.1 hypothetical protein [Theionarchaea archaeon]MBU7034699.1 hypothetical protein [Theionarchaea archaeon]MBU7039360.1 hypothetical protein [Theionarchaea archaeon]
MNVQALLLLVAIVCDVLLMGIFVRDYRISKEKMNLLFVLGLIAVLLICIYFFLEKMGIVIVI